jgi:hypothetical protein
VNERKRKKSCCQQFWSWLCCGCCCSSSSHQVKRTYSSRKILVNTESAAKRYNLATLTTAPKDDDDQIFPIIIHQRDSNCSSEQETKDNEDISVSQKVNYHPFIPTETQSCDSVETIPFNDHQTVPLPYPTISTSGRTDYVIERVSSNYR